MIILQKAATRSKARQVSQIDDKPYQTMTTRAIKGHADSILT